MFWFAIVTYWAVGANLCAAVPQPQTSGLETVAKPQPSELKIASMLLYATVSRGVEVLSFTVNETTSRDDGSVGRNKVHRQHFCDAATSTDTVLNNVIEVCDEIRYFYCCRYYLAYAEYYRNSPIA